MSLPRRGMHYSGMARTQRSYLPGGVFHLASRTQGKEPWFTPVVRSGVAKYMASAIRVSDARLLAYAIMPNHLHLVVQQGRWPLGRIMQPLLRRTALLVQRTFGIEGHVFERPFRDKPCWSPAHVRNAIVYVHLNPVRAGMVDDPVRYRWSSHAVYGGEPRGLKCMRTVVDAETGLRLFAPRSGAGLPERRLAYSDHVDWRMQRDRGTPEARLERPIRLSPRLPNVLSEGMCWSRDFSPLFCDPSSPVTVDGRPPRGSRPDLQAIAKQTLVERNPHMELERVRGGGKLRAVVEVRREMIRRMSAAGHKGGAIARYLGVSDQCVSHILTTERRLVAGAD